MERIVDYKIVVGVLVVYALLIYFGGMATKNMDDTKIEESNYINII